PAVTAQAVLLEERPDVPVEAVAPGRCGGERGQERHGQGRRPPGGHGTGHSAFRVVRRAWSAGRSRGGGQAPPAGVVFSQQATTVAPLYPPRAATLPRAPDRQGLGSIPFNGA